MFYSEISIPVMNMRTYCGYVLNFVFCNNSLHWLIDKFIIYFAPNDLNLVIKALLK